MGLQVEGILNKTPRVDLISTPETPQRIRVDLRRARYNLDESPCPSGTPTGLTLGNPPRFELTTQPSLAITLQSNNISEEIDFQCAISAISNDDQERARRYLLNLPYSDDRFAQLSLAACKVSSAVLDPVLLWASRSTQFRQNHIMPLVVRACAANKQGVLRCLQERAGDVIRQATMGDTDRLAPIFAAIANASCDVYYWLSEHGLGLAEIPGAVLEKLKEITTRNNDSFYGDLLCMEIDLRRHWLEIRDEHS